MTVRTRESADAGAAQPSREASGSAGEAGSSEEAAIIDWEEVRWNERLILELPPDAEQEEVQMLLHFC